MDRGLHLEEDGGLMGKVLLVDDEPAILDAHRRNLRGHSKIALAAGGTEALELLDKEGPFGVIVTDYRMPGMNGVELLAEARRRHPDTTRMILTGQADYAATLAAVNEGNVFRFLLKPCSSEMLKSSIDDAMRVHDLVIAERELLQGTLVGAIGALSELAGLASPEALTRSAKIRKSALEFAAALGLTDTTYLEIAASLSQIGCLTLPPSITGTALSGGRLSDSERRIFERHPAVAERILARIPRLGGVAALVGAQFSDDLDPEVRVRHRLDERAVTAFLAAVTFVESATRMGRRAAVEAMRSSGDWPTRIFEAFEDDGEEGQPMIAIVCTVEELTVGMVAEENVVTSNGLLLMSAGHTLTLPLMERLWNFHAGVGIREPLAMLASRNG